MGASSSTIGSSGPSASYSVLIKNTARDREILERIFMTFLERITPKEMRELSSMTQCKKYAFLMGDTLKKFFKASPVGGPQKMVYYVRMEGRSKEEHNKEFYVNCFQVGYFYIHLLQILCALSLTVASKESFVYSGFQPAGPTAIPQQFFEMPGFVGGVINYGDDIPEILETYLIEGRGPRFKNQFRLYYEDGKIKYKNASGDRTILECTIRKSPFAGSSEVKLDNFDVEGKTIKGQDGKPIVRTIQVDKKDGRYMYYILTSKKYSNLDERILTIIGEIIRDYEKVKQKEERGAIEARTVAIPSRERFELTVENLVSRLKTNSTKPYAIARALQLLDINPVYSYDKRAGADFTSHVNEFSYSPIIGNAPFIGSKDQLKEFSSQTDNLSNVYGLNALDKLYYDNIEEIDIQDGEKYRIKPKNDDEYWNFLKAMDCIYNATSISKDHESLLSKKENAIERGLLMFKIENKQKTAGTTRLNTRTQSRLISIVQNYQKQLFGFQLQHTKNVMAFIQKYIIQINSEGVRLNDNFFNKGIIYINYIGEKARRLLLDYYVKCEAIYSQGHHAINTNGTTPGPNIALQCSQFVPTKEAI